MAGKNEVLPFSRQAQGQGNVIPQINRFASDINETVFNRRTAQRQFASDSRQQQQPGKQFGSGFIVNNRTQNYQQQGTDLPNRNFIASQQGTGQQDFWRSGTFKFRIKGISTGDVDNDGQTETVLISDHAVYIYRAVNDRFAQVLRFKYCNAFCPLIRKTKMKFLL